MAEHSKSICGMVWTARHLQRDQVTRNCRTNPRSTYPSSTMLHDILTKISVISSSTIGDHTNEQRLSPLKHFLSSFDWILLSTNAQYLSRATGMCKILLRVSHWQSRSVNSYVAIWDIDMGHAQAYHYANYPAPMSTFSSKQITCRDHQYCSQPHSTA